MSRKLLASSLVIAVVLAAIIASAAFKMSTPADALRQFETEISHRLSKNDVGDLSIEELSTTGGVSLLPKTVLRVRLPPLEGKGRLSVSYRELSEGGTGESFFGVYTSSGKFVGGSMGSVGGRITHGSSLAPEQRENAYLVFAPVGEITIRISELSVVIK